MSELNPNAGITIGFKVNGKADDALISLRISRRTQTYRFSQFFTLTVNGEEAGENELLDIALVGGTEEHGWGEFHNWCDWDIAILGLKEGENDIVLTTKNACSNLDYMAIYQA